MADTFDAPRVQFEPGESVPAWICELVGRPDLQRLVRFGFPVEAIIHADRIVVLPLGRPVGDGECLIECCDLPPDSYTLKGAPTDIINAVCWCRDDDGADDEDDDDGAWRGGVHLPPE